MLKHTGGRLWVRFRLFLCWCRFHVRLETDSWTFLFCPVTTKYLSYPARIKAPGSADSSWDSQQSGWSQTVFLNSVIEGKQSFVICSIRHYVLLYFHWDSRRFMCELKRSQTFDTLGARRGFERLRAAGVTGQISVSAANVFKWLQAALSSIRTDSSDCQRR